MTEKCYIDFGDCDLSCPGYKNRMECKSKPQAGSIFNGMLIEDHLIIPPEQGHNVLTETPQK